MHLKPEKYYNFETVQQALLAITAYQNRMGVIAQSYKSLGKVISDQDYPIEVISLRPKETRISPLLLIGGMGPLAGIAGFEKACQLFQNNREIVLLQACKVPNRTTNIMRKIQTGNTMNLEHQLVNILEQSILVGLSQIESCKTPIQLIFLCNAAHYFLPQVWQQFLTNYPQISSKIQWVSLIESLVQYLQEQHWRRPLLLCTTGTRKGRIYADCLNEKKIDWLEPNETLQSILMDCIYKGVKAFDCDYSCKLGQQLFIELLRTQPNPDCIIAGCTEIPSLLKWLQVRTNGIVADFLKEVKTIDPLQVSLELNFTKTNLL